MKKVVIGFIAGAMFATVGTVSANTVIEKIKASVRSDYSVELDGEKVNLKNPPLAYNGSSYLPVKEITQLLGKEVDFKDGVIKINTPAKRIEDIPINEMTLKQIELQISADESAIPLYKMLIANEGKTETEKEDYRKKKEISEQRLKELKERREELTAAE